ncbi:MAG: oligosaccharide flippase family protein [Burkholderiales bacterium]|nr:oligosaccharide flippase family protein [Burkholderiales bacterium]
MRRWLQKVVSAGWALVDQCVVSAANFFTIYLFARHMGASGFGTFMLAHTGLLLLTSMQNALVIQPHNVLAAGLAQQEYRRFTGALVFMQAISCAATGAVLGMVGWFVAQAYSPEAGSILIALAIAAIPWMGQEFVRRVLYTRSESRPAALNDTVTYGLQLGGAFVLSVFWADHASPEAALLVLGGSSAVGVVIGLWQLRDHVRFRSVPVASFARTWKEVWNFGKWLTAQNTLVWFGSHGHAWVVGLMLGAEQVGIYRAVTHLVNVLNPVRQAAYSYLPSLGSLAYRDGAAAGLARWVARVSVLLMLALVPFLVVLVGFPGWVLSLAYGERYVGADLALILALAAIAQCITFSKFPFDIGLLAMRATKWIFYVHLIPVALLLTAGVAFIHFLGILGVPLSGIVINSALLGATWLAYAKFVRHRAAAGGT